MRNLIVVVVSTCVFGSGVRPAQASYAPARVQNQADDLVNQLRELPTPLPVSPPSGGGVDPVEQRRRELYGQLWQLGKDALPALSRGLRDPDVNLRRNIALVLGVLSTGSYRGMQTKMDIQGCLRALVEALQDNDPPVRWWAAQAIGNIGPNAVQAVPGLIELLNNSDEGSRNSACIALRGIGPMATAALPALRRVLSDPSTNVRRFAQQAIERIEGR
jgi:HEAT repeat protein